MDDDLLQKVREAMHAANREGSHLGEAGLDLMARVWLAAADAVNMVSGSPPPEKEMT